MTRVWDQYFALGVLFIINTVNFLDRISIYALKTNVESYYNIDPSVSGFLPTCFIVGYMATAPIFGYLGDRYPRKILVIGGVAFWCLSCASAFLIGPDHYKLFFLTRMLVGVGEASYSTIAPTFIGDLFERDKRKLALSIFYLAIPIGSGLGYIMGVIAQALGNWRLIFIITPTIVFFCLFLFSSVKEPIRGQADGLSDPDEKDESSVMENLIYLGGIKSYVWSTVGFTCCLFTIGALTWLAVEFFGAARGKDYMIEATWKFGVIVTLGGLFGVLLGSWLANHFRTYDRRSDPWVCAAGVFLAVPLTFFGLILARSSTTFAWLLLFLAVTFLSTNWAIVSDMVLQTVLPKKRAFAASMQILISHLFGDAASPFIVGHIQKSLLEQLDGDAYKACLYALLPCLAVLSLGTPAFLVSAKYYVKDADKCKEDIEKQNSVNDIRATDMTGFAGANP